MSVLQAVFIAAYLAAVLSVVLIALGRKGPLASAWVLPLGLGAAFVVFSLWTVAAEGVMQFWLNHTANMAGAQVWLDLLIAVVIAFYLMAPRARAVGMRLMPWAVAVFATASIALLPMLARLIWLERRGHG